MILQDKAGDNFLQVPELETCLVKGHFVRHTATAARKDSPMVSPPREGIQSLPKVGKSIKKIRHDTKRGKPTKSAVKKRVFHRRAQHELFNGFSPMEEADTCKPELIIKPKDRMYLVDSGASLHMTEGSLFPQEKNTLEIQTANDIVRSTRGEGLQLPDWPPGGNPAQTVPTVSFFPSRSLSRWSLHLPGTIPSSPSSLPPSSHTRSASSQPLLPLVPFNNRAGRGMFGCTALGADGRMRVAFGNVLGPHGGFTPCW